MIETNKIYTGDCLNVMGGFPNECIDLIYLDPPFNTKKSHDANALNNDLEEYKGSGFSDSYSFKNISKEQVFYIKEKHPLIFSLLKLLRDNNGSSIKRDSDFSYYVYMAIRLIECHRILKDTGSIYLHCDIKAIHYLKLIMDDIFRMSNFRNQIVWRRGSGIYNGTKQRNMAANTDYILRYSKTNNYIYNQEYLSDDKAEEKNRAKYYRVEEETGRRYYLMILKVLAGSLVQLTRYV